MLHKKSYGIRSSEKVQSIWIKNVAEYNYRPSTRDFSWQKYKPV